jgi:hypothetical protein
MTKNDLEMFRSDCSKFLKESKMHPFFRGSKNLSVTTYKKIKPRKNRKPLDTPQELHDAMDKSFKKKFGWKVRSEGVFCIGDKTQTNYYGKRYIILPIGDDYKFVWSSTIKDFSNELDDRKVYYFDNINNSVLMEPKQYTKIIDEMVNTYKDTDLYGAWSSFNEVSIKCKYYYLIDTNFLSPYRTQLFVM